MFITSREGVLELELEVLFIVTFVSGKERVDNVFIEVFIEVFLDVFIEVFLEVESVSASLTDFGQAARSASTVDGEDRTKVAKRREGAFTEADTSIVHVDE